MVAEIEEALNAKVEQVVTSPKLIFSGFPANMGEDGPNSKRGAVQTPSDRNGSAVEAAPAARQPVEWRGPRA